MLELEKVMVGATIEELMDMNNIVVKKIKYTRALETQKLKWQLRNGMKVEWLGKKGHKVGTILEVKRTRALVMEQDNGKRWNCPLTMLKVVKE